MSTARRRMVSIDDISDAQSHVVELRHQYLKERGWNYTSMTPDSCWIWEKTITEGKYQGRWTAGDERAVSLESYFDGAKSGDV